MYGTIRFKIMMHTTMLDEVVKYGRSVNSLISACVRRRECCQQGAKWGRKDKREYKRYLRNPCS